ncbi:unnamed protein product [marine sediment metagenome]|uniref:Uncharacterized protein n=1 Tax=marine sediment metagenome TaxID=412755 RepID=X1D878_9ZZZZ
MNRELNKYYDEYSCGKTGMGGIGKAHDDLKKAAKKYIEIYKEIRAIEIAATVGTYLLEAEYKKDRESIRDPKVFRILYLKKCLDIEKESYHDIFDYLKTNRQVML